MNYFESQGRNLFKNKSVTDGTRIDSKTARFTIRMKPNNNIIYFFPDINLVVVVGLFLRSRDENILQYHSEAACFLRFRVNVSVYQVNIPSHSLTA